MKLISLLIIFTTLFSTQIIEPYEGGRTSLFIYHSGKALVHENRLIEFQNSGEETLNIIGLPSDILNTGFQISANNYRLSTSSIERNFATEEKLLTHFVGNRLMLKDFKNDKTFDATLISYNNGKAVFGMDDGVVVNPQLKPIFPYVPENVENEVFIKTSGIAEMGKSVMKLSYFTEGMNWDAEYHLVINDEDKATFSGDYQLVNNTDKSYPSSEIYLVASTPVNIHSIQKRSRMMAKSLEVNTASEAPEAINLDDVEIYKLSQKISLNNHSNINAQFINSIQIPMEKNYVITHSPNFYGKSGRRQDNMNPSKLYLKLNSSKKIKIHLPKGKVNIYENKDGINMFIAEKQIQKTSKGNDIQFLLKSSQDILHKFTTLEFNETNKGFFITIVAELQNLKDKDVSVDWHENSGRVLEIIESSIQFEKNSAFEISARIQIKAGETRRETLKLFTPKRD